MFLRKNIVFLLGPAKLWLLGDFQLKKVKLLPWDVIIARGLSSIKLITIADHGR